MTALREYTSTEALGDPYACRICKTRTRASRTVRFDTAPTVLLIALKLYSFNPATGVRAKPKQKIHYTFREDFGKYLWAQSPIQYDLCGVTFHAGTIDQGHHFAFCKEGGEWWKCDDAKITRVAAIEAGEASPQILRYRKLTTDG